MSHVRVDDLLVTCDECGVVYDSASRLQRVQEVHRVQRRYSETSVLHYCSAHEKPYDMRTTTSGYDRFYKGGVELKGVRA